MFEPDEERFATVGLADQLPGAVIDSIWEIIDQDLKGVVHLPQVLQFALLARNGQVTVIFEARHVAIMEFDLPIAFQHGFPETVAVLDDGRTQTMMLMDELAD
ncbi:MULTISPECIES: DUF960 domain-containing protein [Lactiplantibacillus]|jgi:hypothetical protein|uniref:DUF960 domain-containing protein n=4 Tax=Lactiplantibacillus pentosus TaxID=1589 RepID=A0A2I0Z0R6_LACPE|nr:MULTISPECIES: DUF960 domain-containing protein [Lactiplantibacillus]EQM55425.1 hypothetical protein N692_02240 [Lactiplantibacillus plantarum EGD-AQ4]CCC15509.1 putative uncharacterized protein lp_1806 [Lactiplantibacillus pentosus IG1]BBM20033.1 uncharacterized protein SN13T_0022 [Lactiplantibacillus plantarum]AUI78710.1 hypothetical protein BB562_08455 [Lactiplantibacillus pentosus]AYG37427.1 hypothetical protein CFK27_05485 [Lactiplantibacillus pentosus]